MKGIDVSKHNGTIDWNKVKEAGYEFAIIRAGYGKVTSQKDPMFEANYRGAKAAGLKVGAYWYSYATSRAEAIQEAEVFIDIIRGKQFEMPVYYDIEESKQMAVANVLISAFCDTMEDAGFFTGVYMSASHLRNYVSALVRSQYSIWVAEWSDKQTFPAVMWQYTDSGHVPGISGNVDIDECYTDFETIITEHGLNGFGKNSEQKAVEELPITFIMNGVKFEGSVHHAAT